MSQRTPPPNASVATADTTGKLFAPAAARNTEPLIASLSPLLPAQGPVLEIASGSGQHVVAFAQAFPKLTWQPSEIDATRRNSIAVYSRESGLTTILPPVDLDATEAGWSQQHHGYSAILLSNLLHLISLQEAQTLISEAAMALIPGGALLLYGPYKRGAGFASEGDAKFDADLRRQDPDIGYKSDQETLAWGAAQGLAPQPPVHMPANNLILHWTKPV